MKVDMKKSMSTFFMVLYKQEVRLWEDLKVEKIENGLSKKNCA
jgi:hypothetical protein